jgi:hypothetical protein
VLPDLYYLTVSDVENDRLAILKRRTPLPLATRCLKHDGMLVARQNVVNLTPERAAREFSEPSHPSEQFLLPTAASRVHASTRRIPYDVLREQGVDGCHVARFECREQPAGDLLVRMHVTPPRSGSKGVDDHCAEIHR